MHHILETYRQRMFVCFTRQSDPSCDFKGLFQEESVGRG